jgi:hypothetical protein
VRAIATQLNVRSILTPRGGAWHPTSAARTTFAFASHGLNCADHNGSHTVRHWAQRNTPGHISKMSSKAQRLLGSRVSVIEVISVINLAANVK